MSKDRQQPLLRRRTRPAPKDLLWWLSAVNGLPKNSPGEDEARFDQDLYMHVISIKYVFPPAAYGTEMEWRAAIQERDRRIDELKVKSKTWGEATVEHVFRKDAKGGSEPSHRLTELLNARDTFRQIARNPAGARPIPVHGGADLMIQDRHVAVRLAPFLSPLDKMEAERLKECTICGDLYWAGRLPKDGCKEECSRVLRQRRLRENRAYKKKLRARKGEQK